MSRLLSESLHGSGSSKGSYLSSAASSRPLLMNETRLFFDGMNNNNNKNGSKLFDGERELKRMRSEISVKDTVQTPTSSETTSSSITDTESNTSSSNSNNVHHQQHLKEVTSKKAKKIEKVTKELSKLISIPLIFAEDNHVPLAVTATSAVTASSSSSVVAEIDNPEITSQEAMKKKEQDSFKLSIFPSPSISSTINMSTTTSSNSSNPSEQVVNNCPITLKPCDDVDQEKELVIPSTSPTSSMKIHANTVFGVDEKYFSSKYQTDDIRCILNSEEKFKGLECDYQGPEKVFGNYFHSSPSFPHPLPRDEKKRVGLINSLNIIDSMELAHSFKNLTKLCCKLLDAPASTINLIGSAKQWLFSGCDVPFVATSRDVSLCNLTILEEAEDVLQIHPKKDPVLMFNPLVVRLDIHFCASSPLVINNQKIGSICIVDGRDRDSLTESQKESLRYLARATSDLIIAHQKRIADNNAIQNLARERKLYMQTLSSLSTGVMLVDRTASDLMIKFANLGACDIFGCTESLLFEKSFEQVIRGRNTNPIELEKLKCAVQFSHSATVVLQCDRINPFTSNDSYSSSSVAAVSSSFSSSYSPSSASSVVSGSFWCKFTIRQLRPIDLVSVIGNSPMFSQALDGAIKLEKYSVVELVNVDGMVKSTSEIEKIQEFSKFQAKTQRDLALNFVQDVKSQMELVAQACSIINVDCLANAQMLGTNLVNVNKISQLSRAIAGSSLFIIELGKSLMTNPMFNPLQMQDSNSDDHTDLMMPSMQHLVSTAGSYIQSEEDLQCDEEEDDENNDRTDREHQDDNEDDHDDECNTLDNCQQQHIIIKDGAVEFVNNRKRYRNEF